MAPCSMSLRHRRRPRETAWRRWRRRPRHALPRPRRVCCITWVGYWLIRCRPRRWWRRCGCAPVLPASAVLPGIGLRFELLSWFAALALATVIALLTLGTVGLVAKTTRPALRRRCL